MKKTIYISLAVLMMAGCAKDELKEKVIVPSPDFTASFEDKATKTFVDSDLNLRWTADDRISVFTSTYNQQYRFTGKTGDNSGTFTKVQNDDFSTGNSLDRNYAVYPYSSGTSIDENGQISLTLPSTLRYAENSFGAGANTMVAVTKNSGDTFLPFKNLCGFLEVKLYGEGTVKSISIKGNNGEKIAGEATVSPVYGQTPEVNVSGSGTEEITIDCGGGVALGKTSDAATSFWFVIPPVTFSKGFTVTATNTTGWSMVKSVSSSKTVQRNVKTSMPALEAKFDTRLGNIVFEDANFKAYCVENFDTDGDGEISYSEAAVVKKIICEKKSIASLKGIEYFTALDSLNCSGNRNHLLTSLDVSKNTSLTYLNCRNNSLTSLDVSKNTALTDLDCYQNQLTSLDVSKNTTLIYLNCSGNHLLTSLDVSKNTALTVLSCSNNQLTSLDVSKNTALIILNCNGNQLTNLDVSINTALTYLSCGFNQLTSLDVSKNTALTHLECSYCNQLTSLDVSKNTALDFLHCGNNQLTSLDVSKNTALNELWCYDNQLTNLDVSKNTALTILSCGNIQLTSLDVSKNTALTELYCGLNQLTSLDVSKNAALTRLYCVNNHLTSLDVSKNSMLNSLNCKENPNLTEIWLKQGQTIREFEYDSSVSTIKYKGVFEAVDLGLSVKWASFNVGAEAPWEYGGYYAWGDVVGQTWNGQSWSRGGFSTDPTYELDSNSNLKPNYDAAHVNLGGKWRMPTKAEQQELIDNCTSTWTDNYNGTGVSGRIFTSNKEGYRDKSIFLPAAGCGNLGNLLYAGSTGYYWSSTRRSNPWGLEFNSAAVGAGYYVSSYGRTVRPVCE